MRANEIAQSSYFFLMTMTTALFVYQGSSSPTIMHRDCDGFFVSAHNVPHVLIRLSLNAPPYRYRLIPGTSDIPRGSAPESETYPPDSKIFLSCSENSHIFTS